MEDAEVEASVGADAASRSPFVTPGSPPPSPAQAAIAAAATTVEATDVHTVRFVISIFNCGMCSRKHAFPCREFSGGGARLQSRRGEIAFAAIEPSAMQSAGTPYDPRVDPRADVDLRPVLRDRLALRLGEEIRVIERLASVERAVAVELLQRLPRRCTPCTGRWRIRSTRYSRTWPSGSCST